MDEQRLKEIYEGMEKHSERWGFPTFPNRKKKKKKKKKEQE